MATYKAWQIDDPTKVPSDWIPITPSDSADITSTAANGDTIVGVRALRSESGGDIRVMMANGQERLLNFTAGETRTGMFLRVLAAGTALVDTAGVAEGIEGGV